MATRAGEFFTNRKDCPPWQSHFTRRKPAPTTWRKKRLPKKDEAGEVIIQKIDIPKVDGTIQTIVRKDRRGNDVPERSEEPAPGATSFSIGYISRLELPDILGTFNNLQNLEGKEAATFQQKVLRLGLRGWKNFKFSDGGNVPFAADRDSGEPTDETIGYLDFDTRNELTNVIVVQSINGAKKLAD